MAKHQKRKAKKKVKQDTAVITLPKRDGVTLLDEEERELFSPYIIGQAPCLRCRQMVHVHNDDAIQGNPVWDRFVNHVMLGAQTLCTGSEEYLQKQEDPKD